MFRRPQFADVLSGLLFLSVGVLTAEAEQHPGIFALEEGDVPHQLLTGTAFAFDQIHAWRAKTRQ